MDCLLFRNYCLCLSFLLFILLKKRQIEQKKIRSNLYQTLTDTIFGIGDWIISGQKERFITSICPDSKKSNEIDKKIRHWNQSRMFQLQSLTGLILIFMGIWSGNQAQAGAIAPTYIAAFTLVTFPIAESLIPISHAIERIPTYQESLQRLNTIEKYVPNQKHVIEKKQHLYLHKTADTNETCLLSL